MSATRARKPAPEPAAHITHMANLPSGSLDALATQVMAILSREKFEIPITKAQLRTLIGQVDTGVDSSEVTIVTTLPTDAARTWLTNNPTAGRWLFQKIVERRRQEL